MDTDGVHMCTLQHLYARRAAVRQVATAAAKGCSKGPVWVCTPTAITLPCDKLASDASNRYFAYKTSNKRMHVCIGGR
jgi:hypothetical protein